MTAADRKLGTFLGVFTPTILTILGVIMYLRFGWLVGNLGLRPVLVIVVLANAITIVTTLAFSAVATNTPLKAGGAYYIISRSLGIELGGAIGLPLFLSQAFSVTLYAYGLAESLRVVWDGVPVPGVTVAVVLLVGALAYAGAAGALRSQVPLLFLVGLSLVALAIGATARAGLHPLAAATGAGSVGFWQGFAVFFPAVSGIMAGLGLSGDLRNPARSVPLGALAAVGTGLVVYLVVPVLLVMGADPQVLSEDPLVWTRIAPLGAWLVMPGLWAAIFSSAVGSILGAPRTLQALASDGLAPRICARQTGSRNDIVPSLIVTLIIALAAVLLGNLNAVAAVVTMFFLTVYGTLNIVSSFEALSGDPSWRPRLRIPWFVTLVAGVACFWVMFLINPLAGVLAVVVEIVLWLLLSRKEREARWGDARRGLYENLIRWALVKLADRPMSARNWRPHVLVFVDDPLRELDLVRFGDWFSQGRGVVTVCKLVVGDLLHDDLDLSEDRTHMQDVLDTESLVVFAEVDVARDLVSGIVEVAQANGMAGMSSNTILLGWPSDPVLQVEFMRVLRQLEYLHKSLVVGRVQPRLLYRRAAVRREVHVWWGGIQRNGDLMLLLAYLLTRNPAWRDARVTVLSLATNDLMKEQTEAYLGRLIPEIRIEASIRVLLKSKDESIADVIQKVSADAEAVFLGLATPDEGDEAGYAARLDKLVGDLPMVFFVKNASVFVGDLLADATADAETRSPRVSGGVNDETE